MRQTRIVLELALAAGLCLLSGCGGSGGEKKEKNNLEYSRDLASKEYLVRLAAVKALSESATPEDTVATPHLIGMLRDGNETIRRFAAAALEKIRDPLAIPGLIDAASDESSYVRYQSVGALVNFYDDPRARQAIIRALGDDNGYVRHIAVTRIGETADPAMVDMVLPLLDDENNELPREGTQTGR
nr:HEAT repeat domain-containing protein [bacterium]